MVSDAKGVGEGAVVKIEMAVFVICASSVAVTAMAVCVRPLS